MKRKIILMFLLVFIQSSCQKEGCTDKPAANYDQKAKTDDGTCVYEADLVFWFDSDTKTILTSSGVTSLHYYLDETLIGNFGAATDFSAAPPCDDGTAFRKSIAYDVHASKSLTYRVEDQNGNEHFSGTVTAVAKSCVPVQLTY